MNRVKVNFCESNDFFGFLMISKLNWIFLLFLLATSYTKANSSENNSSEEENGLINDILCPSHHPDFNQGERWRFLLIPGGNCTSQVDLSGRIHLTCIGGINEVWIRRQNHAVRHFIIQKWPLQCFPPSIIFGLFPSLGNLTIENSNFTHFSEDFPSSAIHLKHLKMNGLPKLTLQSSLFSDLPALEVLDLRGNSLETLDPKVISSIPRLHKAFVINNKWNCSHHDMRWLSNLSVPHLLLAKDRIADYYNLTCQGNMFRGKPLHVVMDLLKSLRLECPPMCRCYLTNLVRSPDMVPEGFAPDSLVPVSTADCRWRKLTELPPSVPSITTVLLLHGNLISSVRPLAQNPALRRVADVYLDDNLVSSLQPLEGADWMLTFRVLSLKGNNITHLPTHAFDNAFQRNKNIGQVFLGQNPWRCDCHFTPAFQELLLKHQKVVVDLPNITCAHTDNEEISNTQILILSRSAICRQTTELLQPMDIINIILSCLIIFVLGKFAYDYYCFKKKGKLPWIVSIIPY